jgi:hypothetical protein
MGSYSRRQLFAPLLALQAAQGIGFLQSGHICGTSGLPSM